MATVFTHALVGAAIAHVSPTQAPRRRVLVCAALLAVLPDVDVVGYRLGVGYGDALGHRGFSHSLLFALLAGLCAVKFGFPDVSLRTRAGWLLGLTLALATASHGVLDAFTDAGLGIGFWLPFDDSRSFAPWRPLATSPLGVRAFFSARAFEILTNEMLWVLLPVGAFVMGLARWRTWYAERVGRGQVHGEDRD